jgi:hypothetical protein
MTDHNTPFASKFFGLGAAVCVLALIFSAQVEDALKTKRDPEATRQELLAKTLDRQLDAEARDAAAAQICGNAGWRLSKDEKHVECVPRRGKPYTAQ